jgi:hypothetical protein
MSIFFKVLKESLKRLGNKLAFTYWLIFGLVLFLVSLTFSSSGFMTYYTKQADLVKKYGFIESIKFNEDIIRITLNNHHKGCYIDKNDYFDVLNKSLGVKDYIVFYTETDYSDKVLELYVNKELLFSFIDIKYRYFNEGISFLFLGIIGLGILIYSILGLFRGYTLGGFFLK